MNTSVLLKFGHKFNVTVMESKHIAVFDYLLTIACNMLERTVLYDYKTLHSALLHFEHKKTSGNYYVGNCALIFMNTSVLLHFEHKCNVTIMES